MMYDELIEQLRETSIDFGESDYVSVMLIEAANAIEDLITALTASNEVIAKSKPKWIPVTERLPKEGDFVLVYGDLYPNKHDGGVIAVSKRMDWNYWQGFGRERDITHWMPLPEPPEDGEP